MRLVVQKFGGSSLLNPELRRKAAGHVLEAQKEGFSTVVVVSAMGRKGDLYATDTLLQLLRSISSSPPPREMDFLAACGELISAAVFSTELQNLGVKAAALSGWQAGIVTNGAFGHAEIIRIKKEKIFKLVQGGLVPVVAGFQGVSEEGEITTLGRGGSDTTAVALGAALEAELAEIYSDVDAVMTADPRLVPEARPIKNINYQEVLQMAREGAKVIHPRAVDIALQYNLPLVLKRTGEKGAGTVVTHKKPRDDRGFVSTEKIVSGITHVTGLAQIRLLGPHGDGRDLEEMLGELAKAGISIDLVNLSPQEKMFTVRVEEAERTAVILAAMGYEAQVRTGFAKVTVVGTGMRGIPGVMARVVSALNRAQTEILQTADSHLNISCLIPEKDVQAAVKSLHLEFGLGN